VDGGNRRKQLMSLVSLLTGVIITIAILFVLVMHTDFFARSTGGMLSRYFLHGTDFTLRIERLSGNPLRDMIVEGLSVRYRGGDFSFDVLRVDRVHLRYSFPSMIRKEIRIEEITVVNPHLWIKPDSNGTYIVPSFGGGGGGFPRLEVDRFAVQGGQVIIQGPGRANALRNIDMRGALHVEEWEVFLEIAEGVGADLAREITVRGLSGGVRFVRRDEHGSGGRAESRILLDRLSVMLDESKLTASGIVVPDSMSYHVKVYADPIDIGEIMKLMKIESSHYGELQGDFMARGNPESVRITGTFTGIFSGYALDDLDIDLRIDSSRIEISSCAGRFNGARVAGSGWYSFEGPEALHFDLDVNDMNLSDGFVPDTAMPETDFNGGFVLDYNLTEESLSFLFELGEGHFESFPFSEATIAGSYRNDSISLDRVLLIYPTHTIRSHGTVVGEDSVKIFFDLECARTDTLFSYFGIEPYRADLVMNGIWEGSFDEWELRASGACSDIHYHGAAVRSGAVKLAVKKNGDYTVFFDLAGDSCTVDRVSFSAIDLSLGYEGGVTSINRLNLSREGIGIEMRGDIAARDGGTAVILQDLFIDALEERWIGGGRSVVTFSDSTIVFDDVQLHSRRGAIYIGGSVNPAAKRLDGDVTFERFGFELLNRAGVISTALGGTGRGHITCRGDLSDPDITLTTAIEGGSIDTVTVDSLTVDLRYSRGRFILDSLVVSAPTGFVRARGELNGTNPAEIYRTGEKALSRGTVNVEAECRRLALAPIFGKGGWIPASQGMLTGHISLSDSLVHPRIGIDGTIAELAVGAFKIPVIEIVAGIGPDGLTFEGTIDMGLATKGEFIGSIPLEERPWLYAMDGGRPMLLELSLARGDVGELTTVTDRIAEGSGAFSAEFRVGGTTSRPDIIGEFTLTDARFRLAGMEEKFFDVNARILMMDTLITIGELRGREGKDGSFRCGGTVTLKGWKPDRYDLTADLDNVLLASVPDILAVLSGRLSIGTEMTDRGNVPSITGDLEVKRAEVYYDIGDFGAAGEAATMESPAWLLTVDLDVPGNTWVKTQDANVEMRGEITVHHDRRGTYLRGELHLIRGWYNVYNNKFRVNAGTLEFVRAENFRPVVNVEAETRDPEGRKIHLDLVWLQDDVEPRLTLYHEDPGYSETDIWKMLGGGMVGSSNGEGGSWDALGTAQHLAANYIERILNSQMEGVTIELESGATGLAGGTSDEKETMVAIGKYLSEGLYVKFKQGLSISSAREIEVEYRISNLFVLRSEIIKYSEKVLQGKSLRSGDEINVDIKLRWEF